MRFSLFGRDDEEIINNNFNWKVNGYYYILSLDMLKLVGGLLNLEIFKIYEIGFFEN